MSRPLPAGCTSRPRESFASGRLDRRGVGEHAPPAERVDDQRRAQLAAVGDHGVTVASGHRRRLELGVAGAIPEQRAQLAVVEGRERPRQLPAGGAPRGVDDQLVEALALRGGEVHRAQPLRRDAAGRGLALADLVAIEHENPGAGARKLARDGEPGEARTAHQHVAVLLQGRALDSPLGRSHRHRPRQ